MFLLLFPLQLKILNIMFCSINKNVAEVTFKGLVLDISIK